MTTAPEFKLQLRPYQTDCIKATHASLIEFDRGLIVMATAAGKTICFSKIAFDCINGTGAFCNSQPRALILVNREELLQQAAEKFNRSTGIYASIERASSHGSLDAPCVVATIQTINRRLADYPADHFGVVIVDEAHLFATEQSRTVIDHFCSSETARLVGVTATPQTKGKKALCHVYETIIFEKGIGSLIQEKFLCNILIQTVPLKIDLNEVRSKAGDYVDEDLDEAITPWFEQVVKSMRELGPNRKWLCFLPLIKSSKKFTEMLNAGGIAAQHVDGTSEDRSTILLGFRDGKFQALSNSLLVTTGYDEPSITGIVNLRPTKSRILMTQIIGRGTRLKPEGSPHDDLLVLDFLWQTRAPDLISPASLVAKADEDEEELKKKLRSGKPMDLMDAFNDTVRKRHEDLANRLSAQSKADSRLIDFAKMLAMGLEADDSFQNAVDYEPVAKWQTKKPTSGQIRALEKFGFDVRLVRDFGHAAALMNFFVSRITRRLASFKQIALLKKRGKNVDANKTTFEEASQMIGAMFNK